MSDKTRCHGCGGLNKISATFCGQCFGPLAGAPAAAVASAGWSAPSTTPSFRLGVEPTTTTAPAAQSSESYVARFIALALVVLAGLGGWLLVSDKSGTITADDGSYSLAYSSYWESVDDTSLPLMGAWGQMSPDAVLVHEEESAVIALSLPIPPGQSASPNEFRLEDLEASLASQPFEYEIEHFAAPGTMTVDGHKTVMEAEVSFSYAGMTGRAEMIAAANETTALILALSCVDSECSEASSEFKEIARSVTFD